MRHVSRTENGCCGRACRLARLCRRPRSRGGVARLGGADPGTAASIAARREAAAGTPGGPDAAGWARLACVAFENQPVGGEVRRRRRKGHRLGAGSLDRWAALACTRLAGTHRGAAAGDGPEAGIGLPEVSRAPTATMPTPLLDTFSFPFRTIGKMLMGFDGFYYVCSATVVNRYFLFTAGALCLRRPSSKWRRQQRRPAVGR